MKLHGIVSNGFGKVEVGVVEDNILKNYDSGCIYNYILESDTIGTAFVFEVLLRSKDETITVARRNEDISLVQNDDNNTTELNFLPRFGVGLFR